MKIIALIFLSTPALYLAHSLVPNGTSCMAKVQVPEATAGPVTSVGMTVAVCDYRTSKGFSGAARKRVTLLLVNPGWLELWKYLDTMKRKLV